MFVDDSVELFLDGEVGMGGAVTGSSGDVGL